MQRKIFSSPLEGEVRKYGYCSNATAGEALALMRAVTKDAATRL
jgi:hypothetical protein